MDQSKSLYISKVLNVEWKGFEINEKICQQLEICIALTIGTYYSAHAIIMTGKKGGRY